MITSLLLRNRSIYILLVLVVLSSCHSSRQVVCPEIDTDHPKTRRYKRNFSLAWNHSRKIPKKSVLIQPGEDLVYNDPEADMTLLETRSVKQIISETTGFHEMDLVRSPELNNLMACQDNAFTGPPEITVTDISLNRADAFDQSSKKEIRKIGRDIRKEMKESFRSSDSGRLHPEDTIMLFSVTSFVLGIIGIFTLPLLLGVLATIFGAVALVMIRKEGVHYGKGLALAGLILGIILTIAGIILLPFKILSLIF